MMIYQTFGNGLEFRKTDTLWDDNKLTFKSYIHPSQPLKSWFSWALI